MNITVVGIGYVGLSNAILLSQNNIVVTLDINQQKIDMINRKKSPIIDNEISDYLANKKLSLYATSDRIYAFKNADFIVIATPTNYDTNMNYFDTSSVDGLIAEIDRINKNATVIIKSTVPVGYTESMRKKFADLKIIFSPEFLREGRALYDNLYPSRIILGDDSNQSRLFASLLIDGALKDNIPVIYTNSSEAEAIKLFSNSYLALRVAFFNELDTYAELKGLRSKDIIEGVGLDPRIGTHYNNPSFGYGGYCLPKDTKQLLANYNGIPEKIISAIVESNASRKMHIVDMIMAKNPKLVGVYRLIMKTGSDNFRESSIIDVIYLLRNRGIKVVIFEPSLNQEKFDDFQLITTLHEFISISDVILTNRFSNDLDSVKDKVYTRDIFNRD